jgi:hypothetical protein
MESDGDLTPAAETGSVNRSSGYDIVKPIGETYYVVCQMCGAKLLSFLGKGKFAVVFKAIRLSDGAVVALKKVNILRTEVQFKMNMSREHQSMFPGSSGRNGRKGAQESSQRSSISAEFEPSKYRPGLGGVLSRMPIKFQPGDSDLLVLLPVLGVILGGKRARDSSGVGSSW